MSKAISSEETLVLSPLLSKLRSLQLTVLCGTHWARSQTRQLRDMDFSTFRQTAGVLFLSQGQNQCNLIGRCPVGNWGELCRLESVERRKAQQIPSLARFSCRIVLLPSCMDAATAICGSRVNENDFRSNPIFSPYGQNSHNLLVTVMNLFGKALRGISWTWNIISDVFCLCSCLLLL